MSCRTFKVSSCSHSATDPPKKLKCNNTPQKVFCTLTFLANLLLNLIMLPVGHFGLIMEMEWTKTRAMGFKNGYAWLQGTGHAKK